MDFEKVKEKEKRTIGTEIRKILVKKRKEKELGLVKIKGKKNEKEKKVFT